MKKLTVVLLLVFIAEYGFTQTRGFGLGLIVGEPTGISARYFVNNTNAFDFGLGYSFTKKNSVMHIYVDYVFHDFQLIKAEQKINLYYGPGGRIRIFKNETKLGIRGVVGVIWIPSDAPLDVFFELAPVFDIIPSSGFDVAGGLGVRYFFE